MSFIDPVDSDKDRVAGEMKEIYGQASNDTRLEVEGQLQQARADMNEGVDDSHIPVDPAHHRNEPHRHTH